MGSLDLNAGEVGQKDPGGLLILRWRSQTLNKQL